MALRHRPRHPTSAESLTPSPASMKRWSVCCLACSRWSLDLRSGP